MLKNHVVALCACWVIQYNRDLEYVSSRGVE